MRYQTVPVKNGAMGKSGINITAPTAGEITINGRSAQWTDLRMAPSWNGTCDWFDGPIAPLMYANTGVDGISPTLMMRMVLVDIGHGDTVLIEISVEDPTRWESVVAEGMQIVQSMRFAEPAASN